MSKKKSIVADVIGNLAPKNTRRWEVGLSDDVRLEIEEIRSAYRDGSLQGSITRLSQAISDTLKQRGISDVGIDGVRRWLTEKP